MDKKSKEVLRRYKKTRQQSSSDSSSDSDSGSSSTSYSSSESERKARHRKKKARQAAGASRRSSSSSGDERRKRDKHELSQKKLQAKRLHLKRKLKEAKLKKRVAEAAAAALSGHSHRSLSPNTQAKLKKLAERKHLRAVSKERRERERHKHKAAREREREREHHRSSRSPTKLTKVRIHQDVKRQKSPPRSMHHQLMTREKLIIQTRTRERTPSIERERERHRAHEHKLRVHDDVARERDRRERERDRAEREAAREKERAEALARCQERQRERERLAREKLRREEEEKKYGISESGGGGSMERSERGGGLLSRASEREPVSRVYSSHERSVDRHPYERVREFDRERDYMEVERRGLIERDDMRREREYPPRSRREVSPIGSDHYAAHLREPHDPYADDDRERVYSRPYMDDARHPRKREAWIDPREIREREREREIPDMRDPREYPREMERELVYPDERERLIRERERPLGVRADWKNDWNDPTATREREWDETAQPGRAFVASAKRGGVMGSVRPKIVESRHEQRASSEPDWDADELPSTGGNGGVGNAGGSSGKAEVFSSRESQGGTTPRQPWVEHDIREKPPPPVGGGLVRTEINEPRRWQSDWRADPNDEIIPRGSGGLLHHHPRGGGSIRGFRRGGIPSGGLEHGHLERNPTIGGYRPPHMAPIIPPPHAGYHGAPRFPNKRNMTYTNPNLIKKQQAALQAAKLAAQASAVAAASTAVAAAKAAAQSAANSTTNPGILGQVRQQQLGNMAMDDKPEAGEIVADNVTTDFKETNPIVTSDLLSADLKPSGELSEISDSDDEILNSEKKTKTDSDEGEQTGTATPSNIEDTTAAATANEANTNNEEKAEDEEMLDFEEISDGELEEDARNKGVGDALGVDWASLIAETKCEAANAVPNLSDQTTTAKQKWQPHRVILDIGISMRMAGEVYAKRLLTEAKQSLNEDLAKLHVKSEEKNVVTAMDDDSQTQPAAETLVEGITKTVNDTDEQKPKIESQEELQKQSMEDLNISAIPDVEHLDAIACIQVAERKMRLQQRNLIALACGPNSRALSARQDLKLRRQLCGLPANESDLPRIIPPVSEKLKAMALAAFQRTLQVK